MNPVIKNYALSFEQRHVDVLNILKTGEIIITKRELEPLEHRFS